jgi:hydrogenase nickel incorporation protein HypA/HybF
MRSSPRRPIMHELSICQSMLQQIEKIVQDNDAIGVHRVRVQIGPLAGVESELLAQAFPIAVAGTVVQGAELIMESLPIRVRCQQCGAESEAKVNRLVCAECGDWHTTLISGDEMLLASVELNT